MSVETIVDYPAMLHDKYVKVFNRLSKTLPTKGMVSDVHVAETYLIIFYTIVIELITSKGNVADV